MPLQGRRDSVGVASSVRAKEVPYTHAHLAELPFELKRGHLSIDPVLQVPSLVVDEPIRRKGPFLDRSAVETEDIIAAAGNSAVPQRFEETDGQA